MRRLIAAITAGALALGIVAGPALAKQPAKSPTIVDVAIAVNSSGPFAGSFDTLIAAVLAADPAVLATLTSNGQYTVFAPTDAAFAELGLDPGNIGTLPQGALTDILLYHVAKGERYAEDVVSSSRIRMLNGEFALVDGATIDGANIIVTDVDAPRNGIIHVVDGVLLP
jgi:uncharacterized surface protein with fasciclin (FAS1) repeats